MKYSLEENEQLQNEFIAEWSDDIKILSATMMVNYHLDIEKPCQVKRIFVDKILDHLSVPTNLSYKERITYYQLIYKE